MKKKAKINIFWTITVTLKLFNTYVLVNKGSNSKCKCKFDLKTNGLKFRPDFFLHFIEEKQVVVSKKAENGNCIGWKEKKLVA